MEHLRIRHVFSGTSARSQVTGDRSFFLRNQVGDTVSLFTLPQTRYGGWLISKENVFFRVLADVVVEGAAGRMPVAAITTTGQTVFWEYVDGTRLGWKQLSRHSGLTLALSQETRLRLVLDIRPLYKLPTVDRSYELQEEPGGYMLRYMDPTMPQPLYVSIRTTGEARLLRTWRQEQYPRDAARHSPPDVLYVFDALEVETDLLGLGAGWTHDEARKAGIAASKQRPAPPTIGINYTHDTLLSQVTTAKTTVQQSLEWLNSPQGILAGLPWFHQVWSRDELIAALGLPPAAQLDIISRYVGLTLIEGELPTFIGSGTTCSDGVGWLCLLVRQYGYEQLPEEIRTRFLTLLRTAHAQLAANRMRAGLIYSGINATWMDTIGREGYPLEIQTMYGLVLEFLEDITSEDRYAAERKALLRRIKRHYWHQGVLGDLLHDSVLRPNVFLAYLFQSELLSQQLWQQCFDKALRALALSWGGLSSIQTSDSRFRPVSSGQDNVSYHNGDSWFFINNLAGIALLRFNHSYYGKTIVNILQGSTEEILWQNMVGMPGEISSAGRLDSWGCGIQAFSGGTYLALLHEFEDYSAAHDRDSISFFWDETAPSKSDSFFR